MTKKRFGYGAGVNWQEDVIIDYETEKSYDFYEVGKLLNELNDENEGFKNSDNITELETEIMKLKEANKDLKSLCKTLITHIEKNSIAFVIDKNVRRLLE